MEEERPNKSGSFPDHLNVTAMERRPSVLQEEDANDDGLGPVKSHLWEGEDRYSDGEERN